MNPVSEYINYIHQFSLWLDTLAGKKADKKELTEKLCHMMELSAAIGKQDDAQRLYHLAGGYRELEFFMPVDLQDIPASSDRLIVMITHELSRTGAPVVFLDAAKLLKKNGWFVVMISPMDGALREDVIKAGIPLIIDHYSLYGRCEQEYLMGIYKEQKWPSDPLVRCADLIFINSAVLHNVVMHYQDYDKKIIWWLHEGNVSFEAFGDCLPRKLPKNVRVVFVSRYVKEQLEASGIRYDGEIMPYGVEDFSDMPSSREKENDLTKFILVGAVSERKGQDILLDAVNRLPLDYLKRCCFYFVGSPADRALYDRLEMLSDGCSYISLFPSMPREELLNLYKDCDYIVCPSRDDPLPVVITEMMILSKPCICSTHTGTASFMEDGVQGNLFSYEDTDKLVSLLKDCIDHPEEKNTMGKAARALYEKHFTLSEFERNLLALTEKMRYENKP